MLDSVGLDLKHLLFLPLILLGPLFILFLFLFTVSSSKASREHANVPSQLPWVGRQNELFASIRANIRGFTRSVDLFTSGYKQYSMKGLTYVVPTWTKGPQVIVPPSLGNWIASRPDGVLNAKDCTFDTAQFTYTVGHPQITSNDMVDLLIKRELTRTIGALNDEILEEVDASMNILFGQSTEWKEVGVFDSLTRTVGRVANRTFVGKELCANMDYLMAGVKFARDVSVSSYVLHLFPKFMKPFVAWFVTYPNRKHAGTSMKYLIPLVEERLGQMTLKQKNPAMNYVPPEDWITWMIRESFKRDTEDERSVYSLAYRVVLLQFAAITTSTIMATNALLDIWSASNSEEVVPSLREEASRVYAEHGNWSKAALAKLIRLDSAIRESSRMSGVGGTTLARKVRADNGVTLPNGVWIPKGSTVGVSMDGIHRDEKYYPDPAKYDAFRFSRAREDPTLSSEKRVNEDLVTTSDHYLLFSHGLHACPGRFFAANNVKMIFAHLLLNYDVEHFQKRPSNYNIGDLCIVPVDAKMRVRRRSTKS